MGTTGDVIRRHRKALGLSQQRLGQLVGVDQRQIARYESGETDPPLSVAVRLSEVLDASVWELAGVNPRGQDLSGDWWAAWQTVKDSVARVDVHELGITQDGAYLQLLGARASSVEDGSYAWTGEMRIWDNESLLGWYRATDGAVQSKGAMYMALHPDGTHMIGGWVGLSYQAPVVRGWAAIVRDRDMLEAIMEDVGSQGERDWLVWSNTTS